MAYKVKKADIHKDKDLLLQLLTNNREKEGYPYEKRHNWLYYQNPYGPATAWIIWNEAAAQPAGFTAVYPRKILVNSKEYTCWNCGDFSIEKKYRTLGIAIKLRRAAKEAVDGGEIPFLYAHPNNRMRLVHLKAGHREIANVRRYALPVRLTHYFQEKKGGKLLAPLLNPLLIGMLKTRFRNPGDYEHLTQDQMHFTEEYRQLCEKVARKVAVVGVRDNIYLTWKYAQHPVNRFQLFNYYEKSKLVGYIVYYENQGTISMTEIFGILDDQCQTNMLRTFVNFLLGTDTSLQTISTVIHDHNPFVRTLKQMGFKQREDATSSAISYAADPGLAKIIHQPGNWYLTSGDRDA